MVGKFVGDFIGTETFVFKKTDSKLNGLRKTDIGCRA